MQLKLLNFHKFLSNISINMIGAFLPLIIYTALIGSMTSSMALVIALSAIIVQYLVRFSFVFLLRNMTEQKPQIVLLIRVLPMIVYCAFLIMIDYFLWPAIVGMAIFSGINEAMRKNSLEILFNYSEDTKNHSNNSLGLSRLIEQFGAIAALLLGGILLDLSTFVVVIISLTIYIVSVIPLVIFYIKGKKEKTFNQDKISNAHLILKKNPEYFKKSRHIISQIMMLYGVLYFVFCFPDALTMSISMFNYITTLSYTQASIYGAIFNGMYGVGSMIFGKLNDKKDIHLYIQICAAVDAVLLCLIPFVNYPLYIYFAMFFVGICYAGIGNFVMQRLLVKCRIIGSANLGLFVREQTSNGSVMVLILLSMYADMKPAFIVMSIVSIITIFLLPVVEEKSRKLLVDYLQVNENAYMESHPTTTRKKHTKTQLVKMVDKDDIELVSKRGMTKQEKLQKEKLKAQQQSQEQPVKSQTKTTTKSVENNTKHNTTTTDKKPAIKKTATSKTNIKSVNKKSVNVENKTKDKVSENNIKKSTKTN